MKHLPLILYSLVGASSLGSAQDASEAAKILGELSDGSPALKVETLEIPRFDIIHAITTHKQDHSVSMCRVERPAEVLSLSPSIRESQIEHSSQETTVDPGNRESPLGFGVSSTVVDRQATIVEWWSFSGNAATKFRAVSNIDWTFLQGFISFQARGEQFTFMHFPSSVNTRELRQLRREGYNVEIPRIPRHLPSIRRGARYVMLEGDESNEEAMEFIEAIHELYDVEKRQLKTAHRMRKRNYRKRARQLQLNPPPKENVTVHYWKESRREKPSIK